MIYQNGEPAENGDIVEVVDDRPRYGHTPEFKVGDRFQVFVDYSGVSTSHDGYRYRWMSPRFNLISRGVPIVPEPLKIKGRVIRD